MTEQTGADAGKPQLHLRLAPEVMALLDACRGAATRPAYAAMVLERELRRQAPQCERPVREEPRPEFEERRIEQEFTTPPDPGALRQDPPKRPRRPAPGAAAVIVPEAPAAGCGHSYPDVRNIAGVDVCRKCG